MKMYVKLCITKFISDDRCLSRVDATPNISPRVSISLHVSRGTNSHHTECVMVFRSLLSLMLSFLSLSTTAHLQSPESSKGAPAEVCGETRKANSWSCDRNPENGLCLNPRTSFESYYYNFGQPLFVHMCNGNDSKIICEGMIQPPITLHRNLMRNVSFVWAPAYMMTTETFSPRTASSGFVSQFDLCTTLADLGMETFVTLNFSQSVLTYFPRVKTIQSVGHANLSSFSRSRSGRVLVAMPEINANRLHRIMNRTGVLAMNSTDVRWLMWVMGLHRSIREIRATGMRVIANIHHSLKQFYSPGASPITANIPESSIRGSNEMSSLSVRQESKRNLVLIDRDAYYFDSQAVFELVKTFVSDVDFVVLDGMSKPQVRAVYREAKITIDSFMLGGEAINFEGALWYCLPMVTSQMSGYDNFDLILPSELKMDPFDVRGTARKIVFALQHYESLLSKLSDHRHFASNLERFFVRDVSLYFSGSSALFVTSAMSFGAIRSVVPWALSVWSAFPTARIEIYVSSAFLFEKELEAQLDMLSYQNMWYPSFVTIHEVSKDLVDSLGEHVRFVVPPKSTGHEYIVFSKSSVLFLGRDLLNAHVEVMDAFDLVSTAPIHLTEDVPVVVARSDLYWRRVSHVSSKNDRTLLIDFLRYTLHRSSSESSTQMSASSRIRSLPLDVVEFDVKHLSSTSSWDERLRVHVTYDWTKTVGSFLKYNRAQLSAALDPLVRHPLWLSLVAFFPEPYQYLTFSFPSEKDGGTSVLSA